MPSLKEGLTDISMHQEPIRLNWEEKNNLVVVVPDNEDRFCVTVEQAVKACRSSLTEAEFRIQFKELLNRLAQWILEHKEKITSAHVTIRDAGLMFLVVRNYVEYDKNFEDELTVLDVEIARDLRFNQIKLSVMALPKVSPQATACFLALDDTTLTYAGL